MKTSRVLSAIAILSTLSGLAGAQSSAPAAGPSPEGVVNVNTATPAELALLPGIGETKAQAIVRYRTQRRFTQVEDLLRVSGIGQATLRRLRPYVAVSGETTLRSTPRPGRVESEPTPQRAAGPQSTRR